MYLRRLELRDFRNYESAELDLSPGITTIVGSNGQGKTNLVEAVGYLTGAGSHRVPTDAPLVREGCDQAVVRGGLQHGERAVQLDVSIARSGRNKYAINNNAVRGPKDLMGTMRAVVFAPEDLGLIKGDPAGRRQFTDHILGQLSPRYGQVRSDYDKVVRQRNATLKSIAASEATPDMLALWDDQLVGLGSDIVYARGFLIAKLQPHVTTAYATLAGRDDAPRLQYEDVEGAVLDRAQIAEQLHTQLIARRSEEIARGITVVGPHRDDVYVSLRELPAKGYASHGEAWSLALSWKLGAFELLGEEGTGDSVQRSPILILDDVFSELDANRRGRLAEVTKVAEQTLITAAVEADVPTDVGGDQVRVQAGVLS